MKLRIALNIAAFYAAWFAAILAAARSLPLVATAACVSAVALHLALSKRRGVEAGLMLAAAVIGFSVETLVMQAGLATYAASGPLPGAAPLWLVTLWMAFATMLNVSFNWLKSHLWLSILLALVVAPPSYYAGAQLGAMELAEPAYASLAAIGVLWAIVFPALLVLARLTDPEPE